ncbi:ankyrin repeat domain-containing protein 50-like isoform X2 [Atheta coriaria]
MASLRGHLKIVQELLRNNADVNVVNEYGSTALMTASMKGHHDVVQELIKNNEDVNVVGKNGNTALMRASIEGHLDIVQELIKNNADINVVDRDGNTALMRASMQGHLKIVQELIKNNADVNIVDRDGNTALMRASMEGHLKIVQELLRNNADVNVVNKDGNTALMLASMQGHLKIVQELQKHFDNASLVNHANIPSLIVTSLNNYVEMVERLLKYGDNIRESFQNYTELIWASGNELHGIVLNFLKKNDKTNLVKIHNCTSLICATLCVHLAMIEELLKHGGSDIASLKNSPSVVQELFTCIANLKVDVDGGNICVVMESIKKGFDDLHERMVKKYVNCSKVSQEGRILFEWTSLRNYLDFMNELLQNSINIETVNTTGYTMLSTVSSQVHLQIVEKIANYNEEDKILKHHHTTLINCINHIYLVVLQVFEGSIAEKFVLNI